MSGSSPNMTKKNMPEDDRGEKYCHSRAFSPLSFPGLTGEARDVRVKPEHDKEKKAEHDKKKNMPEDDRKNMSENNGSFNFNCILNNRC